MPSYNMFRRSGFRPQVVANSPPPRPHHDSDSDAEDSNQNPQPGDTNNHQVSMLLTALYTVRTSLLYVSSLHTCTLYLSVPHLASLHVGKINFTSGLITTHLQVQQLNFADYSVLLHILLHTFSHSLNQISYTKPF